MFGIIHFELFLMTTIFVILTPGTDTMYILSRSIAQGKKAGVYSTLGIMTGIFIHTLLAAFGLSIILVKSIVLFTTIKIAGMTYLVYLGVRMLLAKKSAMQGDMRVDQVSSKKMYFQGMITNVTNPKVILFYLAFIPQFIDTANASPLPFVILGFIFSVLGGLWCLLLSNFASAVTKKLRSNSKIDYVLNKITGLIFIAMGIKLVTTRAS